MIVMCTGHREPQGGDTILAKKNTEKWLKNNKDNIEHAICGAAMGYDTVFGEICVSLNIPLWLYEPFRKHGAGWPHKNKVRHAALKNSAAGIIYVCEEFSRRCFLLRDERMVKDADFCLAYLADNPKSRGTAYTVQKAEEKGISVENFYKRILT